MKPPEAALTAGNRAAARAEASGRWRELAHLPDAARVALVAADVWQFGYQLGYREASCQLAGEVESAAATAATNNSDARHWLTDLADAAALAATTADGMVPRMRVAMPAAVLTKLEPAERRTATALADAVLVRAVRSGAVFGGVETAAAIRTGLCERQGAALQVCSLRGQPALKWADDLLVATQKTALPTSPAGAGAVAEDGRSRAGLAFGPLIAVSGGAPAPRGSRPAAGCQVYWRSGGRGGR